MPAENNFWELHRNQVLLGVGALAVIGIGLFVYYNQRPKTEAEIKQSVLESLRASEPAQISDQDRGAILNALQTSRPPATSDAEKQKVLDALRTQP